jgi:heme/copper-type cytochrome/quinol oxidase subunit 3
MNVAANTVGYVALVLLSTGLVLWVLKRSGKAPKRLLTWTGLGALLVVLGLYFFPLGALEAYDATRRGLGLSELANGVLWYALTTGAVIAGILLLVGPRRLVRGARR